MNGSNEPPRAAERRRVTTLFADLSGFTALSDQKDEEYVWKLLNACLAALVPIIEAHGGTIDKFVGDEIMGLFGTPLAQADDPERAIRAALAMRDELARFNIAHQTDLGMHFGINTGPVITGYVGAGSHRGYTVIGDSVNVAARLLAQAKRDEILVGLETYELTRDAFAFSRVRYFAVKGKPEPVAGASVLGLLSTSSQHSRRHRQVDSPLVGRTADLARLQLAVEEVLSDPRRRGRVISITGEAGLGKSRLIEELHEHCIERSVPFMVGHAMTIGRDLSYWPFIEMIREYVGIQDADSDEQIYAKVEERLGILFGDTRADVLPYLMTLLRVEVRDQELLRRVQYLSAEAMGGQILVAMRRLFERLSQTRALVLVFEDLHWVDTSSAGLIEHLLSLTKTEQIVFILAARLEGVEHVDRLLAVARTIDTDRPGANEDDNDCKVFVDMPLAPLSESDSSGLLGNLLAGAEIPVSKRQMILATTGGNPFFTEEVIRSLIDQGGLVRTGDGRLKATRAIDTIGIPTTVQLLIDERISRLQVDLQDLLKLAAVIGRSFFERVLRSISRAAQGLDRELEALQRVELIRERRRLPDLEYLFRHPLVQRVAYKRLLKEELPSLHRRVAESIEAIFANRLEEFYGLLAHHYAAAQAWHKAEDYLLKAGDQAGRIAADGEALEHYRNAMAAHEKGHEGQWDPLQRAALERKIGEALFRLGKHDEATENLRRALRALGRSPRSDSRRGIWVEIVGQMVVQAWHRLSRRFSSVDTPSVSQDQAPELFRIYQLWAWLDYFLYNRESLIFHSLKCLNLSEKKCMQGETVVGLMAVGCMCDLKGWHVLASTYHRKASDLAARVEHPVARGYSDFGLGVHKQCIGDWDTALHHYRKAADEFESIGDFRLWGTASSSIGLLLAFRGAFREGVQVATVMIQRGTDSGDKQLLACGLAHLAHLHMGQGEPSAASIAMLENSVDLARGVPDNITFVNALALLSACHLREGRWSLAGDLRDECRATITSKGLQTFMVGLALNRIAEGSVRAAARTPESREAREEARRDCQSALRQTTFTHESSVGAYRWQGTVDWLDGRQRSAEDWWAKSLAVGERTGAEYEIGLTHLEKGLNTGDRAALRDADKIFADVGARYDLARARWPRPSGSARLTSRAQE